MKTRTQQRGGFAIGLIVGLLIGLALALGVALYVTKAPNPFVNKVPQRTAAQDAAEAERNRNWDPNSALAGKNPARASSAVETGVLPPATLPPFTAPTVPSAAASTPPTHAARASAPTAGNDRAPVPAAAGRASQPLSTVAGTDPFIYFVQAGAYSRTEDAEQQRARLALAGIETRLTEREQSGRTVFRVRVGPFDSKDEADAAKARLNDAGVESALVRVQK